ncbi:tiggrin [Teleopsis dalmanni]|uniref:tiggrin n=1 Tax=Teleopsis dalmanni TaxID=139649 RepID=UPI0018CEE7B0|nr:tiggrin [Teleopsis dalmanni]
MKAFSLILLVLALAQWSSGYRTYQRQTSNSYSSSRTSSDHTEDCCLLNSWAYSHMNEVHQFANRLRQEYNQMSQGSSTGYVDDHVTPWNENIINLTGKTSTELDALSRRLCEQLVTDMRKGLITYNKIAQPNFFEWKAAQALQSYANPDVEDFGQQQALDIGLYQPVDLSNFDEVKNYAYPAEVKVIDGKTYVVQKNETEAHKIGDGTFANPLVTVLKRNRTTISTNTVPGYSPSIYDNSAVVNNYPTIYVPGGGSSTTTVTRKKTIYDWVNKNMEPSVVGYNPVINIGGEWGANMETYKPPVHIGVDNNKNFDAEVFQVNSGDVYRPSYNPGSTVTVTRVNKTIISHPDGTNTVHGSEVNKKWVDGKLVIDTERPFGEWTVPRDEAWKREERERFFWFLSQGATTPQRLEQWQRQQEERLLAMAQRYHTTVEDIQEWHRKELERYRVLCNQYQAQSTDTTAWKRLERGRLDWLIHQNSISKEELERWQRENQDKLMQLARQYRISLTELKNWQIEELNRLYVYFNDQNNSMMARPNSDSLRTNEQERLNELIRKHNESISNLQKSIQLDQQKLVELSLKYRGNVQDMEKWLKEELARINGAITEHHNEMTRISEWQRSERERLEDIVKHHQGSVADIDAQMARDRNYIQALAAKYHVSIEDLEKWQRSELERLNKEGQTNLELGIKEWQKREREHLMSIVSKNDLTIEEFQTQIMSDRARLEDLAKIYKIQVSEVENWIKNEIKNFQSQGLLKEVEKELAIWQQKERDRLQAIVKQNELTVEELQKMIKTDQGHLYALANTYHVRVDEIEEWLKKEMLRLQGEGLIKVEDLKDWQKQERDKILNIVQQNKLTIEEFEKKLLADRKRLQDLSNMYNVKISDIEVWIKKEGERLQGLGLLQMQEQLNNWQKIERDRLLALVKQNNLTVHELEDKIKKDQVHLYSLAHQHQVRVEEIEEWIKNEILRLQQEGVVEMEKLKDWQTDWRGNLTNLVQERDFTVEEFHKWLLEDRARLQTLAMQHNVQIEEIEQWVRNEEQRFIALGLLKPNEKLTNWQEVERRYLERITQEQYHSTEQLEQRLRQDRELLEKLARDYSVQVEEIEKWMQKELARLRDDGQLQIDNLTAWQIAERERLEKLIKQNKQWSATEFELALRKDREHMQKMAFQYHTSVEEIEKWIQSEVGRLQQQGKLNIEQLTAWQKAEHERILNLLQQQSIISVEDFERKVQQDRRFLMNLANQYHVSVIEVEEYIKKVIDDLRDKGKFEVENLQTWQFVERDYIKQLLDQYNNELTTKQFEDKLLTDRAHLQQLANQYKINVEQIEKWMIEELQRLRKNSENHVKNLSVWQVSEAQRLKDLIQQNNRISYVQFEMELMKERARLQELANQYSLSVEQIETWLRQQLLNLKTKGEIQVENLTKWQEDEQKRLIDMLLQQQNNVSFEEFEMQLRRDNQHLQQLARQYSVSVEQIERWMRDELQRLKNSGLLQVEKLTYWQKIERDRLQDWLKQQNNAATYEDFTDFLKRDKERLQRIANDYHITVEEVESWVQQEGARLQILGMVKRPVEIIFVPNHNTADEMWKVHTRAHLEAVAQVKPMSWQDFERYLTEERIRWEQIARTYNITVEEIEMWLRQSAQELSKKGLINGSTIKEENWQVNEKLYIQNLIKEKLRQQPQLSVQEFEQLFKQDRPHLMRLATQYHVNIEQIETWVKHQLPQIYREVHINHPFTTTTDEEMWKVQTRAHLQAVAQVKPMNWQQFENYLKENRMRWEQFARQYNITVEEIEFWLRDVAQNLSKEGLIHGTVTEEEWQFKEQDYIQKLIDEKYRKQQQWSLEELERQLKLDIAHLQNLATQYHVTVEEIEAWYKQELQRLLDQRKIVTENLTDWQSKEKDRLYWIALRQPGLTQSSLEKLLLEDKLRLNTLADEYHVSIEELEYWIKNELRRLVNLGILLDNTSNNAYNRWQQEERERLRTIVADITITEEELLEFIAGDHQFQLQLAKVYGCSLDQLAPFQRIEIGVMEREGLFDHTKLLKLEHWQKRERDRLYSLIKNQNISLKNLKNWQRQDMLFNEWAAKYGISVQALKDWQLKEYDRIQQLAEHYKMSLSQLQQFREKEIMYLTYIMHKKLSSEAERIQWAEIEEARIKQLEHETGLTGEELLEWRRRLYLLCQGLLPMNFGTGGYETGKGSTNVTNVPHPVISKDRGDQPPNVYDEKMDFDEPGVAGQEPLYPLPSAELRELSTRPPAIQTTVNMPGSGVQSGYRYTKKEYQFTVPVGVASATATADSNTASASASVGGGQHYGQYSHPSRHYSFNGMQSHALTTDEGQQQQQEEQVDDFGQQQQVELAWNGQYNAHDIGQQQQVELAWNGQYNAHNAGQQQQQLEDYGQQQVQVEDLTGTFTTKEKEASQKQVVTAKSEIEVKAEAEPSGFWGKLKQKTTDIFG